jgi:hypothetical protein
MTCQEAQEQYIEILQKWHGYCSTLFDVKVSFDKSVFILFFVLLYKQKYVRVYI